MGRPITSAFQVIPRGRRARHLVRTIRRCSQQFKTAFEQGQSDRMEKVSEQAWDALTNLFEILRGEQDEGNLPGGLMTVATGALVSEVSPFEQQEMIQRRKIDRAHPALTALSLRDALNKIAHYKSSVATFRIDGRGAHYLVLGGSLQGKLWVAEILVSKLCTNAAAALAGVASPHGGGA